MLYLKSGLYNNLFKNASLYDSTFLTHQGKFWWLRVLMHLTQEPVYFQFVVESVLCSMLGDCPLPVVVYLDDIAIYGDTQKQVLEDMLKAIKQLTAASFMLNFHKSQLFQAAVQVLRHLWTLGNLWASNIIKCAALLDK